jgi:Acetyltransferase (GNAT) domain
MRHEFINPLTEPEWNNRLGGYRAATVFHSAQWARVLAEAYGYRPHYALFREGEKVVGMLPIMEVRSVWTGRRGVCLPFSDECAPLITDGFTLQSLLQPIRDFGAAHRWDYLELRGGVPDGSGIETGQFVSHHIELESTEESQLRKLRDSTRRNIQRADREGVEIQHLDSLDAMDIFYSLHCRTRRRHGLPPQPRRFFHLIHKYLIGPGSGFISLARFKSKWIAGSVFLRFGPHAVYKFGASDPSFQHVRANNLVMWQSIRRLQKDCVSRLSLGRSESNDDGLLQFKRGWGGEEVRLSYYRIGLLKRPVASNAQGASVSSGFPQKVMQRLPIPVLRLVGGLLYRHVG